MKVVRLSEKSSMYVHTNTQFSKIIKLTLLAGRRALFKKKV